MNSDDGGSTDESDYLGRWLGWEDVGVSRAGQQHPMITVIMPSLNVRPYIEACVASVLNQSLGDIEILCVDADSADGTWEILQAYAAQDNRIRLLRSTQRSYGAQVNQGLRQARGEYVAVFDTDDYIRPGMLASLLEAAREEYLDYVKADYAMFVQAGNRELVIDPVYTLRGMGFYGRVIDPREYPVLLLEDGYLWRGLYSRKFLQQNHISLQESPGAAYQDNGFLHQTICRARRVMYLENSFYCYRRDNAAASGNDPRGLAYVMGEYDCIEQVLRPEELDAFHHYYYAKMWRLLEMNALRFPLDLPEADAVLGRWQQRAEHAIAAGGFCQAEDSDLAWQVRSFLEEPLAYVRCLQGRDKALRRMLKEFLQGLVGKEIVLVSAGEKAQCLLFLIHRWESGRVLCFCDNSPAKQGGEIAGLPVLSVAEAVQAYAQAHFVIVNLHHTEALQMQLAGEGVTASRVTSLRLPLSPHIATSLSY